MERVVEWLPRLGQPWPIRFLGSTLIMGVAVVAQLALSRYSSLPGLSPLLAAVFAAAVSFDRGTGLYASALAVAAAYFSFAGRVYPFPIIGGLVSFGAICLLVAVIGEGLRKALERAIAAEHSSAILLRELQHRTQNTLAIIDSLLGLQARASANSEVKAALNGAAARVRIQAEAYRQLTLKTAGRIDARQYLTEVCHLLEQSFKGVRPIRVECAAQDFTVDAQKALAIGLIANELVTNSVKYAFREAEPGTITVALDSGRDGQLRLRVRDDGAGCPEEAVPGVGTRLIEALVKEHKGSYERVNGERGCQVTVTLASAAA